MFYILSLSLWCLFSEIHIGIADFTEVLKIMFWPAGAEIQGSRWAPGGRVAR